MPQQYQQTFPTAQDLIDASFRDVGILVPTDAQRGYALIDLNRLLDSWSADSMVVYSMERVSYDTVALTTAYTIGVGMTWVLDYKPIKITDAFVRDGIYDYPIDIIASHNYNQIQDKSGSDIPTKLFYRPEGGNWGTIYLSPTPDSVYTIYLDIWHEFQKFTLLSDALTFASGYSYALSLNLAVVLAPQYNCQLDEVYLVRASNSKTKLFNQNQDIPEASFDVAITFPLMGSGGLF